MFSSAFKLQEAEKEQLISLIDRKEFRALERAVEWQIASYTDRAMAAPDDKETTLYKAGASALKEFTVLLHKIWKEAKQTEKEAIEKMATDKQKGEKNDVRIFQ